MEESDPDELLVSQGCHQEAARSCILEHKGANNRGVQSASASGHLVGRDCFDSSEVGSIHSEPNGSDSGPNGRNVPPTSAGALLVSARSPYLDLSIAICSVLTTSISKKIARANARSSYHRPQASPFARNPDEPNFYVRIRTVRSRIAYHSRPDRGNQLPPEPSKAFSHQISAADVMQPLYNSWRVPPSCIESATRRCSGRRLRP